jgi:hypothetical protein
MAFLGTEAFHLALPAVVVEADDIGVSFVLPALTIEARDADAYALIDVPAVTLNAYAIAGEVSTLIESLPAVTLHAAFAVGQLIQEHFVVPAPTLSAEGFNGQVSNVSLTLPKVALTASAFVGGIFEEAGHVFVLPKVQLNASGLVGEAFSATLVVPRVRLDTGDMYVGGILQEDIPAITLEASGAENIIYNANISVPEVSLNAYMVVSVTTIIGSVDYEVWTMNTVTAAHSTYSSWNVNSYGEFNGVEIILLPDGIYEITGTSDAGTAISAVVEWPPTDLGSHSQKRVDSVSVNMRNLSSGAFNVTAVVDEQRQRLYRKDDSGRPEGMYRHRVLFPKGLNGSNWKLGFKNDTGSNFVLDELDVYAVELPRKYR